MPANVAMAVGAHPDDIEFLMGGTLLLLRNAGFTTHYINLANGSCGSAVHGPKTLRVIRRREARAAAGILGATFHESLVDDLDLFYERPVIRRLAAVMREIQPTILVVPSPVDYMEDHTNTCRLAVTAAFVRNMRNFKTSPLRSPVSYDVTLYHALPHGLRDPLRRKVMPGIFVDTETVHRSKVEALAAHQSQNHWLDTSQKMSAYVRTMEKFSREVGRMSGKFKHAEGWRRHLHYGFCPENADPLCTALGDNCSINRAYEKSLEAGR